MQSFTCERFVPDVSWMVKLSALLVKLLISKEFVDGLWVKPNPSVWVLSKKLDPWPPSSFETISDAA